VRSGEAIASRRDLAETTPPHSHDRTGLERPGNRPPTPSARVGLATIDRAVRHAPSEPRHSPSSLAPHSRG
jgi:hypothetical protein